MALSTAVAVAAVIIGDRLDLIGLLIVGPCAAVFSGQGRQTALVAAWAVVLAAGIGAVNGIWGTFEQVAFVSAVVVVSAVATAAAYIIERVAPSSMRTLSEPASAASTRSDHN